MTLLYSDMAYRNRLIDAGHPPVCVHRCLLHHFGSRTILSLLETPGLKTTMASEKEYFYRKWNTAYCRSWRNHCIGINPEVPCRRPCVGFPHISMLSLSRTKRAAQSATTEWRLAITFSGLIGDMQQVRLLRVGIADDLVDNRAMRSASAYRRHPD
jgi:hypothetical protein